MNICLKNISKRFDSGWIIKNLDLEIKTGDRIAIRGANGSGKSSLIKIISGYLSMSKGRISYDLVGKTIDRDDLYKYLSISTAYSELDEELNPVELFQHFSIFKKYLITDKDEFIDLVDLRKHKNKAIKYFSSGMKQRLNLALAICMDVPLLIMDEPTSFLDAERKIWYKEIIERFAGNKTIVVASNEELDFEFCNRSIVLKTL